MLAITSRTLSIILAVVSVSSLVLAAYATGSLMMSNNNQPSSTTLAKECSLTTSNIAKNVTDIPGPLTRNSPTSVMVHLQAQEQCAEIESGASYQYWTFNGTVPGPLIRVLVGDNVTIVLKNNDAMMTHSIDLHAVTGPGGGMMLSTTTPGQTTSFWFTALYPGLYVYHCAEYPADDHIANGMYGMILVEPQDGLSHVDKEFYVMQGEFYTTGAKGMPGMHGMDTTKMLNGLPDYVVFNGRVGGIQAGNALRAQVGQTIRIFFGVGGPNLESYFHIIGAIMNKVHPLGVIFDNSSMTDVQTTVVPPGGAAVVQVTLPVAGTFTLVDHSLSWAIEKGAAGSLIVSGTSTPGIFSGS